MPDNRKFQSKLSLSKDSSLLTHTMNRRKLLLGTASVALAAACGNRQHQPEIPSKLPDLSGDYPESNVFVSPEWLAERIKDSSLRLLDLSALPDYRAGHIPGSRHVWWQDTMEIHNPVYGMLVGQEGRSAIVRDSGITADSIVVCYDGAGGIYASRLIWMLRYMGFMSGHILNGGLPAWQATGHELTCSAPASPPAGDLADHPNEAVNASAADIQARLGEAGLVILDTRTSAERAETWDGRLRIGTIPDSLWLPRDSFLATGIIPALVPAKTLRQNLMHTGIDIDAIQEIIVFGLHAALASLPYLAISALNQFKVRLYDGSWSEWGSRDALPIEELT